MAIPFEDLSKGGCIVNDGKEILLERFKRNNLQEASGAETGAGSKWIVFVHR